MTNEIEKSYNALSKKYKLPSFAELNEDFEISDLENTDFLLRNILRKAAEKIEFYSNLLNDLLQPDTSSLSSMHETRFFLDEEKNNMYNLFKKMMKHYREIIGLVLKNNEKEQAAFLGSFIIEWAGIKKQILSYLEKMSRSWEQETTIKEDLGYFG